MTTLVDRPAFESYSASIAEKLRAGTLTPTELKEAFETEGPDRDSLDEENLEPRLASTSVGAYAILKDIPSFLRLADNDPLGYTERCALSPEMVTYVFFPTIFDCLPPTHPWFTAVFRELFPTIKAQQALARWIVDRHAMSFLAGFLIQCQSAEFLLTCLEYATTKCRWQLDYCDVQHVRMRDFVVELIDRVLSWWSEGIDEARLATVLESAAEGICRLGGDGYGYQGKGPKRVRYLLCFWQKNETPHSEARFNLFKRLFATATPLQLFFGAKRVFLDAKKKIPSELWRYIEERFRSDDRFMLGQVKRVTFWDKKRGMDRVSLEVLGDGAVYVHWQDQYFFRRTDSGRDLDGFFPSQVNTEHVREGDWVVFSKPLPNAKPFYQGNPPKYSVCMFN